LKLSLKVKNRHFIRSKKIRELKAEIQEHSYQFDLDTALKNKIKIELVEFTDGTLLYLLNNVSYFLKLNDLLIPTLFAVINEKIDLAQVTVDMGAIKFIVNGADIMAPGILKNKLSDDLKKGNIVKIVDENFNKPIAIGQLLEDASKIKQVNKGKVIKNLHVVGDKLYQAVESLHEALKG